MKKNLFLLALLIATTFGFGAKAQVSVRFNIGLQPLWGPVGYDYVDYYYLPDIDAYFDVTNQVYVYYDGGRWITSGGLPPRYASYDVYHGYKVVINQPTPWLHHDRYRTQYAVYRGRGGQHMIRDSRVERYWENPNHPQHGNWHGNKHDEGRHEEHGGNHGEGHGGDHGGHEGHHDNGHHGH